jgi:hypothetical protein
MELKYHEGLLFTSIEIKFRGKVKVIDNIVLDTGAAETIISPDAVEDIGIIAELEDNINSYYGIGGSIHNFFTKKIHDLSRLKSTYSDEYARQNMPFELGLDMGCKRFSKGKLKNKKLLILEVEQFRYRKALSDISGLDIKCHENKPSKLIHQVRNWFVETLGLHGMPSGTKFWYIFTDFASEFYDNRLSEGYTDEDLNMMPIPEYIDYIKEWCKSTNAEQYIASSNQEKF